MTNLDPAGDFLFANLQIIPSLATPLYQQLYERLRNAILNGQIAAETRLPSTRTLAETLGVSRNTVLNAYDQLAAEGYIVSKEGSGTVVASLLPETLLSVDETPVATSKPAPLPDLGLSQRGRAYMQTPSMSSGPVVVGKGSEAFRLSQPALDVFPFDLWHRCVNRRTRYTASEFYSYQEVAGYRPLREAIAHYLIVARGVRCSADQVIIVSGSQGGLDLASRILLDPGDSAWFEDPGYLGARGAIVGAGGKIVPVPVDDEGLNVAAGLARCPDARVAYVTPSHQFPLAITMSLSRRLALLDWATRTNAWILEDDYNSEFRYAGRPLMALQGLDSSSRVIYIGTFSKVLFPALRLGYLVVPESLIEAFESARRFIDVHPSMLEQMALADFMEEGHLTRHIRRMRTLYAERRELLVDLARRELPLEIHAPEAGMHLVGWLPDGSDDQQISQRAAAQGISASAVSKFSILPLHRQGLLLGYASVPEADIRAGVPKLRRALLASLPAPLTNPSTA
ncbi:MAG: PLP-dependent aminotransferase family protein [Anaerolineae bacterium]